MLCCGCGAPPRRGIRLSGESIAHRHVWVHRLEEGRDLKMKVMFWGSILALELLFVTLFLGIEMALSIGIVSGLGGIIMARLSHA